MPATTLTLTDFLLERIEEDGARYARDPSEYGYGHAFRMAECEAKRRIVESMSLPVNLMSPTSRRVAEIARDLVLGNLATPYADHPDYREEWRV